MHDIRRSALVQPFYPALDGLRAVAFLMVFSTHYATLVSGSSIFQWGWAGVDVFFVLSGFLITGILYDSLHRNDFFRNFYLRRALRIFPLFYGFFLLMLLVTPLLHIAWNRYNFLLAIYLGNFFIPGGTMGLHPEPAFLTFHSFRHPAQVLSLNLTALWSLCVEEQFYLVWPAVVWWVRSRKALLAISLGVMTLVPCLRLCYAHFHAAPVTSLVLYYSSWSRMDTLLCGSAIALWLRGPTPAPRSIRIISCLVIAVAVLLLTAGMVYSGGHANSSELDPFINKFGYSLIALASAGVLLLTIDPASPLHRILRIRPLAWLGRISYGLYFYHGLPANFVGAWTMRMGSRGRQVLVPCAFLAATILLAKLSFVFLESPFLKLKSVLAPRPGVEDPSPGGGGKPAMPSAIGTT